MSLPEIRAAAIKEVETGSPAHRAGIRPKDRLVKLDGKPVRDLIDYYLLLADDVEHVFSIERGDLMLEARLESSGAPVGIEFESPVFDGVTECDNHCIFCFVDQLPAGLSQGLYVKDDDYRLSFLCGNFITLTNFTEQDRDRVLGDMLSPLYVSLHATEQDLRERLFANPRACRSLEVLEELIKGGIEVHVQLVMLRGVNDGEHLDRTLSDILSRFSSVASVGVVPVGMATGGRKELPRHLGYERGSAWGLLKQLEKWYASFEDAPLFASDEFFYLAEEEIPKGDYYGDFPQLENGIGLTRAFRDEAAEALDEKGGRFEPDSRVAVVTSTMGEWALSVLELECLGTKLVTCRNGVFGDRVNVCGLLGGRDIMAAIAEEVPRGYRVLIPQTCVNERSFLDGTTVDEIERESGVRITIVPPEAADLINNLQKDG